MKSHKKILFINPYISTSTFHFNPFCFNFLTGELLYLSRDIYELLKRCKENNNFQIDEKLSFHEEIVRKKLAFKSEKSRKNFIQKVLNEKTEEILLRRIELGIFPTFGCNLSCKYCINKQVNHNRSITRIDNQKIISIFEAIDTISKKNNNKIHKEILLSGGEPLTLNSQVLGELLKQCKKRRFLLKLNTNGTLISHHYNFFRKNSKYLSQVQITIDGPDDTHNKLRSWPANKTKSFSMTMRGIKCLKKLKIPLLLRTNITKENIDQLEELYEIYKNEDLLDNSLIQFKFVTAISFRTCSLFFSKELQVLKVLTRIRNDEARKFILLHFTYPSIFTAMLNMMGEKIKKRPLVGLYPCTAMIGKLLTFGPDGNIYTCINSVGIKPFMVGSYWPKFSLDRQSLNKLKKININYFNKCRKCNRKYICRSGCPLESYVLHRNLKLPICRNVIKEMQDMFSFAEKYIF